MVKYKTFFVKINPCSSGACKNAINACSVSTQAGEECSSAREASKDQSMVGGRGKPRLHHSFTRTNLTPVGRGPHITGLRLSVNANSGLWILD
jgi:hypothetical protein